MELLPPGKALPAPLPTSRVSHRLWTSPILVTDSTAPNDSVGVLTVGNWNFQSRFQLSLHSSWPVVVYMCGIVEAKGRGLPILVSTSEGSYSNISTF